ncbi:transmembrane protein 216 isoform X1 [Mustela erminea]|uniref:transmembrane protein 216 isoform X1 n=2 Tax=Mustela erminea TaxID=36723 RepID=UPI0013871019|nr:transmembrane protein 216 isoform X1 [Mustela erminea]
MGHLRLKAGTCLTSVWSRQWRLLGLSGPGGRASSYPSPGAWNRFCSFPFMPRRKELPPTSIPTSEEYIAVLKGKRLSSTPLEILFFLNGWYYATYFLLELFIFLYKALLLPYPTANLVLDVVMLLLYLGIEVIRLFFGTKGNLCQRKMPLGISVALTFPSAMMASYYLLLQTYVLRLEAIMNSILLFFCGSELLLEVLTLTAFSRSWSASYQSEAGILGRSIVKRQHFPVVYFKIPN